MFSVSQSVYYLRFPHIPSADFKYSRDWVKCELNVWDWVKGLLSLGWVCLFLTPWAVACQAPLSMEFSRQEYWSGLSFPSPGDLPDPGIEPGSTAFRVDFIPAELPGKGKWKSLNHVWLFATPWTVAYQAPPSTGFSREEYGNGVPSPSPEYRT